MELELICVGKARLSKDLKAELKYNIPVFGEESKNEERVLVSRYDGIAPNLP